MKNNSLKTAVQFLKGDAAILLILSAVMVLFGVGDSFAGTVGNDIGNRICEIPDAIINTSIGRGLATIGIIILGIMATLGRITWTQAVVVGVGISVIFGAVSIAGMLAGSSGSNCSI